MPMGFLADGDGLRRRRSPASLNWVTKRDSSLPAVHSSQIGLYCEELRHLRFHHSHLSIVTILHCLVEASKCRNHRLQRQMSDWNVKLKNQTLESDGSFFKGSNSDLFNFLQVPISSKICVSKTFFTVVARTCASSMEVHSLDSHSTKEAWVAKNWVHANNVLDKIAYSFHARSFANGRTFSASLYTGACWPVSLGQLQKSVAAA